LSIIHIISIFEFLYFECQLLSYCIFYRLFTESPEAKDSFSNFANIDVNDDYYNEVLHRHGSRVKNAVGKIIDSLDYPYEYKKFLIRMGARHYKEYNFDPQYSQVIKTLSDKNGTY